MMMVAVNSSRAAVSGLRFAHGSLSGAHTLRNDDAVLVAPRPGADGRGSLLCAVADGVGGLPMGAKAARAAVQAVDRSLAMDSPLPALNGEALRRAVLDAHVAVQAATNGSGATTLVGAVVSHRAATIANVGDSRAYLLSGGILRQLTLDHTWAAEQARGGLLSHDDAARHPWRSVLTRCLGGAMAPDVDLFDVPLACGDRLLLCSDGLPAVLSANEIAVALAAGDPEVAVAELLTAAKERRARDDVTVCVCAIVRAAAGQAAPADGKRTRDPGATPVPVTPAAPTAQLDITLERARRPPRTARMAALLLVAAGAALLGALAWLTTPGRVTPGVTVAGAAVGGLRDEDAAAAVTAAVTPDLVCPLTLRAGSTLWVHTPADLGLWLDAPATVAAAAQIGRRGDWRAQLAERLAAAWHGVPVAPVVRVDSATVVAQVEAMAAAYARGDGAVLGDVLPTHPAARVVVERLLDRSCAAVDLPLAPAGGAPGQTGRD